MLPRAPVLVPDKACDSVPILLRTGLVSTESAVRDTLATCVDALHRAGACDEEKMAFEIALAEALNNIVEHAYAGNPDGWVDIALWRCPDETLVELRDAGAPLPDGPPNGNMPMVAGVTEPDELPEGGFGWAMIRVLTRNVQYFRAGDQNILVLCFGHSTGSQPQSTSPKKIYPAP